MPPETLSLIKSSLPKGYRKKLKLSTGFSLGYIDLVLRGHRSNQLIIDTALEPDIRDNPWQEFRCP